MHCENNNNELVNFLRKLAESIELNELSQEQMQHIGEFFMSYKYEEIDAKESQSEEFEQSDVIRFLTLGWYIYQIILKEKTEKEESFSSDEEEVPIS